jgi:hypothetical protein
MTIQRMLLAVTVIGLCAGAPLPAQQPAIGIHGGVNFDRDEALIGAQLLLPLGRRIELYPSLDYYFTDPGSLVGINIDLKFGAAGLTPLYLGGGVNLLRGSGGSRSTGANLFAGLEGRGAAMRPYLEFRVLLHDNSSSQLLVGINWSLF